MVKYGAEVVPPMKFLVTSRKKSEAEVGDEREILQMLLDNFEYYDGLVSEGAIVDSGVFPGEHASYSVFNVADEEEVWYLLESAPLDHGVYHDVKPVIEHSKAKEKLEFYLEELL